MVYLLVAQSGLDGQQLGNSSVASSVWGANNSKRRWLRKWLKEQLGDAYEEQRRGF